MEIGIQRLESMLDTLVEMRRESQQILAQLTSSKSEFDQQRKRLIKISVETFLDPDTYPDVSSGDLIRVIEFSRCELEKRDHLEVAEYLNCRK
jgi:hypothetical protein